MLADARGPDDLRLYAIGDIHGRLDLLRQAHGRIAADLARRPCRRFRIIHLGDVIDRGPDSAGVVEHLIEFCRDGDATVLAGNHDLYAPAFLKDPGEVGEHWLAFGGLETLASYGVEAYAPGTGMRSFKQLRKAFEAALPPAHRVFFDSLAFTERHGDFLFVHAGVRPGVKLEKQKIADLTWIREPFLSHDGDFGAVVVHGHTIAPAPVVRPNRIGIDTKAYASGRLTCLAIEGAEKGFIGEDGFVPVLPPGGRAS
jgi:serine/threonine protein phosphatase 1